LPDALELNFLGSFYKAPCTAKLLDEDYPPPIDAPAIEAVEGFLLIEFIF